MDIILHQVNNSQVGQRRDDGYLNATAMCGAFNKDISNWLALNSSFELVAALASRLNIKPSSVNLSNSVNTKITATFPTLVVVEKGAFNSDETWIHYKLAVPLAMWINSEFGLLVSDWVENWLTIFQFPVKSSQFPDLSPALEAYIKSSQALNRTIHTAIHQQTDSLREALKALEAAKNIMATNGNVEVNNTPVTFPFVEKLNDNALNNDQLTNDQQEIIPIQKIELTTPLEQDGFYTTLQVFASTKSQRKGCLYKYLDKKTLKNGTEVFYPRVTGAREERKYKALVLGLLLGRKS